MTEEGQSYVMGTEDWIKRWDNRQIGFHKTFLNPLLEKHAAAMIDGRSNIRVFVPLCGKSLDMMWLANQGHTVIGVDVAEMAIKEFFTEQNVSFTSQFVPAVDGTLFQSEDHKLQIYCCDFFKISRDVVGEFDGIWDRGALVAINLQDHVRYVSIIKSVMATDCRCLLVTMQYDTTNKGGPPGPPHHISDEDVKRLYENDCIVEEKDDTDALEPRHKEWGLDWLREKVYLISSK